MCPQVPENVNTLLQIIGRVHRLGQKEEQQVLVVTIDHTYDQIIQAKSTKKMMAQVAGEGHIVLGDQLTAAELEALEPEMVETTRQKHARAQVTVQAADLIRRVQGQRSSRLDWDNVNDLRAKDNMDDRAGTPRNVRKRKHQQLELDKYFAAKARRLDKGEPHDCSHQAPLPSRSSLICAQTQLPPVPTVAYPLALALLPSRLLMSPNLPPSLLLPRRFDPRPPS